MRAKCTDRLMLPGSGLISSAVAVAKDMAARGGGVRVIGCDRQPASQVPRVQHRSQNV